MTSPKILGALLGGALLGMACGSDVGGMLIDAGRVLQDAGSVDAAVPGDGGGGEVDGGEIADGGGGPRAVFTGSCDRQEGTFWYADIAVPDTSAEEVARGIAVRCDRSPLGTGIQNPSMTIEQAECQQIGINATAGVASVFCGVGDIPGNGWRYDTVTVEL